MTMSFSPEGQERDTENVQGLEDQLKVEAVQEVEVEVASVDNDDKGAGGYGEQEAEIEHIECSSSTVGKVHFDDHFTLENPSGAVRYRGANVRVLEQRSSQILLEQCARTADEVRTHVTVKKVSNERAFGLNFLRFVYLLFCLLFSSMLFIFCFLVLLFLFMDLVPSVGLEDDDDSQIVLSLVGALFASPMFIYGFASAMAIAATFVSDTWSGHVFLRTIADLTLIFTEWAAFLIFIGIPVIVGIISLFMGLDDWWQIMTLVWFCCLGVYYVFFAAAIIYHEVHASFQFMRELDSNVSEGWQGLLRRAILIRMTHHLSGIKKRDQLTMVGKQEEIPHDDEFFNDLKISLYSQMTLTRWFIGRYFDKVHPPERLYSPEEILGTRQFVTRSNWSLEKIFCSRKRTQMVTVVRGPSALLPSQMKSSFACAIVGGFLVIVFFVAMITWASTAIAPLTILVIAVFCCIIPLTRNSMAIFRMYKNVIEAQQDEEELDDEEHDGASVVDENEGIFQTFETYRVTRPNIGFCWTVFFLEVLILIIWPNIILFVTGNYRVGFIFIVVSGVSLARIFLDPSLLIAEAGSFDILINPNKEGETPTRARDRQWKSKHRLSTIVLNITRSPTFSAWMWIFLLLALIVIVFAAASLGASEDAIPAGENLVILPQGDFVYQPQPNMPYPSCRLSKGLEIPGSDSTALIDYAFLAEVVYQSPDLIQDKLDEWFGDGFAVNEEETVERFRQEVPGGQAAVAYFLVRFPSVNSAVVVVRGSTTSWEWLTNAQLWGAAAVAQVIRFLLPVGELFTPILDELLLAVSWIEDKSLEKISLYRQTTSFVEALQADGSFAALQITGHSLGGGIAIITGAQTGIPAVAVSGPNAMLSRRTFDPPVSEEALNTNIFNIVPDRDIVPRIDDVANLYQRIQCRGPKNDFWTCHSSTRSLCEIAYQCGTENRPALCICATEKGYPEPEQIGGSATFTDLCGTQRSNV